MFCAVRMVFTLGSLDIDDSKNNGPSLQDRISTVLAKSNIPLTDKNVVMCTAPRCTYGTLMAVQITGDLGDLADRVALANCFCESFSEVFSDSSNCFLNEIDLNKDPETSYCLPDPGYHN